MNAIEVKKISKTFQSNFFEKGFPALKDLSFSVKANTITGFLGENGSGKTTTYKTLLGAVFSDSGEFKILGERPDSSYLIKNRIGFMPERPLFLEHLNAREFLNYSLRFYKKKNFNDIEESLKKVGLSHVGSKRIKNFSKGMIQRLGIAQAIAHRPDIVILDEPMSGLDPSGRYEVSEIIKKIKEDGATVFFSSHLLDDVQKLCDEVVVIDQGSCVFEGSMSEILEMASSSYKLVFEKDRQQKIETFSDYSEAANKMASLLSNQIKVLEFSQEKKLEKAYMELNRERDS